MGPILRIIAGIMCVLSVVGLAVTGFGLKITFEPLQIVLGSVDRFFAFAEDSLLPNYAQQLYPHWKYFFVVLTCFFFSDVFKIGSNSKLSTLDSAFAVWGLLVASVSSLVLGGIPLHGDQAGAIATANVGRLALVTVFACACYSIVTHIAFLFWALLEQRRISSRGTNLGRLVGQFRIAPLLGRRILSTLVGWIGSSGFVMIALQLPAVSAFRSPDLVALGALAVAVSLWLIVGGMLQGKSLNVSRGITMLAVLLAATVVLFLSTPWFHLLEFE